MKKPLLNSIIWYITSYYNDSMFEDEAIFLF